MLTEKSEAFAGDSLFGQELALVGLAAAGFIVQAGEPRETSFADLVAQGLAEAEAASRNQPEYCHWVKTNNRYFKGRWVTSQWVGFISGERAAVVTYDGRPEAHRRRFMAYAVKKYIGHYRTWQEAQEEAATAAVEIIDGNADTRLSVRVHHEEIHTAKRAAQ